MIANEISRLQKKIFISVISHGHGDLIKRLNCIKYLAIEFIVVVKINKNEDEFTDYLRDNNIKFIDEYYGLGFGANNNLVFNYCRDVLGMKGDDIFIVLNPDVVVKTTDINNLKNLFLDNKCNLATVNLFKNEEFTLHDCSVRNIPTFTDFLLSFGGVKNRQRIDKSLIKKNVYVDWCAGSFMAFTASHYSTLRGFDEKYFMYCEDIDICFRSKCLGVMVYYIPDIKILHLASHSNRRFLSRHFFWHLKSVLRFLIKKRVNLKMRSRVL